uniref:Calmodulin n=1 Tax=Rhodosorus marinus TaxID=101924 RepID=A0A7S2ZFU4_9RHOD|mmetsp:Transcript_17315/g.70264  ORF Transcript_17315/g.70264 Transcript_17315/m.70264 type:complete len:535 (+) Transcript_17315:80-1684(+)
MGNEQSRGRYGGRKGRAEGKVGKRAAGKSATTEPKNFMNVGKMPKNQYKPKKYAITVLDKHTETIYEVYDFGKLLGEGSFGTCYLGTHKRTQQNVAIKTISKGKIMAKTDIDDIRNEILIMEAVSGHSNIVQIFGAYEDEDNVHIVLELCTGGDLFERVIAQGKYSEKDCANLCRQMLEMVEHCHSRGVVHRDLKPENFLLDSNQESANLKATDFGLSCFYKGPDFLSDPCGTPMYIAPEVIKGKYTHKADIWSAGVVLYILLSGKVPFYGRTDEEILRMTLRGHYNLEKEPWPHISEDAKECVRTMLTWDPTKRPEAKEMLGHRWMREDGTATDKPLVASVLDNLHQFNEMNKFKKKALQLMACNMDEGDLRAVRKAFDEVDLDGSGTITLEEMRTALEKLGNKVAEAELLDMWRTFDLDGNGTIDYEEFLTATTDLKKVNTADNFRYAFKKFDKDGDGSITVDEVLDALKDIGVQEEAAAEIVREADLNNDGVIDYDEFVQMMTEKNKFEEASNHVRNKNLQSLASKVLVSA